MYQVIKKAKLELDSMSRRPKKQTNVRFSSDKKVVEGVKKVCEQIGDEEFTYIQTLTPEEEGNLIIDEGYSPSPNPTILI
uniref:Uncharacterized protein n=1 Tax=Romanomermis culicivorax TaxID=13658 RepID=A0A915ISG3_ROMCU